MNLTAEEPLIYRARDWKPMNPASPPLTTDELAAVYRTENDTAPLTQVRPDFYQAVADLLSGLQREYHKKTAEDPDSVMAEGLNQRRKEAERQYKAVVSMRAKKIAKMTVTGAEGAKVQVDLMTPEERAYYDQVVALTRRLLDTARDLQGDVRTVATRIDEPPPAAGGGFPPPPPEDEEGDFYEPVQEEEEEPEPAPGEPDYQPVLIRVLEDLPEFVGPDRTYRLSKEDVVTLPKALADILVNTRKADAVAPTP